MFGRWQLKASGFDDERRTVSSAKPKSANHVATRGRQRNPAFIGIGIARLQGRLLAADARGQYILDFAVSVPDQPFSADQLYRLTTEIGEPHGIRPHK